MGTCPGAVVGQVRLGGVCCVVRRCQGQCVGSVVQLGVVGRGRGWFGGL